MCMIDTLTDGLALDYMIDYFEKSRNTHIHAN